MTATRASLAGFGTSTLSDALDRLGIEGQALGIKPVASISALAGTAYTVRMTARGLSGHSVGDYIDDVAADEIVVIDNAGRLDVTVWGDILTTMAKRNGVGGTVIDGVCRDVARSIELGYPVFAKGNAMRTGKDRVSAEAYCEPVQLSGARVDHGDWIVGDLDGVVVVPASRADQVIQAAEEIAHAEDDIRRQVLEGGRLDEIRKRARYHELQRRPT